MIDYKKDFDLQDVHLISYNNLSKDESEMIRNWRNSDEIKKWMYSSHYIAPEEHSMFMQKTKNDAKNFYWLAKDKSNDYIGVISINRVDFENKNAYFGLHANPSSKARGIGRSLNGAIIKIAFDLMNLHTLKLEVIENNRPARDLYLKMGFHEEGKLRDFIYKDGHWHNIIIMGLTNKKENKPHA